VREQLGGGGEFFLEIGDALAKREMAREFDKANQVATTPILAWDLRPKVPTLTLGELRTPWVRTSNGSNNVPSGIFISVFWRYVYAGHHLVSIPGVRNRSLPILRIECA
jgi:hypothetical protein